MPEVMPCYVVHRVLPATATSEVSKRLESELHVQIGAVSAEIKERSFVVCMMVPAVPNALSQHSSLCAMRGAEVCVHGQLGEAVLSDLRWLVSCHAALLGPRLRAVEQEFSTLAEKLERVKGQASSQRSPLQSGKCAFSMSVLRASRIRGRSLTVSEGFGTSPCARLRAQVKGEFVWSGKSRLGTGAEAGRTWPVAGLGPLLLGWTGAARRPARADYT